MDDNKKTLQGIGGWLLVLIIWLAASIVITLGYNFFIGWTLWPGEGIIRNISLASSIFFIVWNLCFLYWLIRFIQKKPESLKWILSFMLASPILNIISPIVCSSVFVYFVPEVQLAQLIKASFQPEAIYTYLGPVVFALAGFIYLKKSSRVKNTYLLHP